jgi:uncharacterized protein
MRIQIAVVILFLLSACASPDLEDDLLPSEASETLAAARAGSPKAMEAIGEFFHYGNAGVVPNLPLAFQWYQAAAEAGLSSSQTYVGMFYADGIGGVNQDCGESIKWFLRASENGDESGASLNNAAWMLSTCTDPKYRDGHRAIELSQRAIKIGGRLSAFVGTLAVAHAEIGDFHQAVALQKESIWQLQFEQPSKKDYARAEVLLESYSGNKPWRGVLFVNPESFGMQ